MLNFMKRDSHLQYENVQEEEKKNEIPDSDAEYDDKML